jgi:hypothetical protein
MTLPLLSQSTSVGSRKSSFQALNRSLSWHVWMGSPVQLLEVKDLMVGEWCRNKRHGGWRHNQIKQLMIWIIDLAQSLSLGD